MSANTPPSKPAQVEKIAGSGNAIDQYRHAKSEYLRLRTQAKKELIARFHQASNELFQIQRELLEDFGEKIAIPSKPKKNRAAKAVKGAQRSASPEPAAQPPGAANTPEIRTLQQNLQKARKRLSELQSAGKPVKTAEDRIYELEDALRLAHSK